MPSPPRTVLDGLEDLWEGAAAGWRETNRRREEAEAAKLRAQRQMVQTVSKGVQQAASGVKAGVERVKARVAETKAGMVVDALLGSTTPQVRSGPGTVDLATVDRRRAQTKAEMGGALSGYAQAAAPVATAALRSAAGVNWYKRVKAGGAWDDRGNAELANTHLPSERRADPNALEYQGNFSYGATAEALGIPKNIALFAGGVVQRKSNLENALAGGPLKASDGHFYPPYGDDPYDQRAISDGYEYGRQRARNGR
ncbi:MAG: hypothetical protein KKE02_19935 [Alphaproteobacteria bacterium]|nr:hypothetical protein [Alphaproteobacteria bacterium]MBU1514743.1 hypothetical protein [Alphaproteobacteria bacterium]MBU2093874.1 hypothetical protein [Alphaproteobacteria bacterium]MBU2153301.1 hypothetical protein [Alphaproteobacteria bacterium]MBU2309729.1 hypothetical protein [Alphaproteobacteria bacterium]